MILYLTDGTTEIDLTGDDTGIRGCTYFPATGDLSDASVTDRADLILQGTASEIRTAIRTVELLLEGARNRQAYAIGPHIYLMYSPLDSETAYRSEIYDGRVVWSDNPGLRRLQDGASADITAACALVVERAPYWEGAEVELEIASISDPVPDIGGVHITNDPANDSGNFIAIDGSAVDGNLPGLVRLQYHNDNAGAINYRNFYIGVNAFGAPGFEQVLQGESALAGYGTVTLDVAMSDGAHILVDLTGGGAVDQCRWLLPAPMMAAQGRYFRLLLRMIATTDITLTPVLYDYYGLMELWRGAEYTIDHDFALHDLGAAPIPPGPPADDSAQVTLALLMRSASSGSAAIDYIALIGQDSYRHAYMPGMSTAVGDYIELDEIERRYSQVEATIGRHPIIVPLEQRLTLQPAIDQRIHILVDKDTGAAPIDLAALVQLYYRPRRTTV